MKTNLILLISLLALLSCTAIDSTLSTRGVIDIKKSKMDGTQIVSMSPVLSTSGLKDIQAEFGLYWDSSKGDNALFIVEILGAENFNPEMPFELKVDGEHIQLRPASKTEFGDIETYYGSEWIPAHNKSRKNYLINKNQILKIANGKEAYYKIWFLGNKFSEGEISYQFQDYQSFVPYSFRQFYSKAWN